jgi:predicted nucleic acid-binding protein
MMRVAFDTNVLLDAIAVRENYEAAQELIAAVSREEIQGIITANSITDIYYIARKRVRDEVVREIISNLLTVFDIAPVDGEDCASALILPMDDFEDAVLAVCAAREEADYIVTRDARFLSSAGCPVPTISPAGLLDILH